MTVAADHPKTSIRASLAPVTALLIGTGLLYAGFGLQTTLVPLRADAEGFDRIAIGLIGSAYYVGFIIGCLFVPRLIVTAGHIRAFAALMALVSAAVLAFPLLIGGPEWILLRVAIGVCISGLMVIIESWLNEKSTNATRGVVMSAYIVISYAAIVVGQMGVTTMPLGGFALFSICSIVLSLAAVPVALTKASQPAPVPLAGFRPRRLYARAPAAFVGILISGLLTGSVLSLATIFALDSGATSREAALFVSAVIFGGALGQYPFGRLSDFMDRRLVLLGVSVASGAVGLITVVASVGPIELLLAAGMLYGFVMLPAYSIAAAHAFDWTELEDMVETSSGLILVFGIGSVLGPALGAVLMQIFGPPGLFLMNVAGAVALSAFLALRMFRRKPPDEDMRSDFDIYSTAPVGGALTPEPVGVDDAYMEAPANYVPTPDAETERDATGAPLSSSEVTGHVPEQTGEQ